MTTEKKILVSAGEVLTMSLLNKIDKAAYQFGGLEIEGGWNKKTAFNLTAKTTVLIKKQHVKDTDKFQAEFEKTMSAYYFKIKFV